MELEKIFSEEWTKRIEASHGMDDYNGARLLKNIEAYGGVSVARRMIGRDGSSENFEILKKNNRLDLSLESLIVKAEYADLFEDDEVNNSLALLCDCGYFG
ncbi:MAG: hypothetical protein ACK5I7_02470 [Anaerotignum sp.]